MFLGEVRMGNAGTILNVVFDTGSDWLVVPDIKCVNCNGTLVDSTISGKQVDSSTSTRAYGSAYLIGTTWTDKVCLSQSTSSCV
jgi:hypothetical protein